MQIPINKEIRHYQEEIFLGLNLRQMICSGAAIAVAVAVYLGLTPLLGHETAGWVCIVAAAPIAAAGFFTYDCLTFEKFLLVVIDSTVIRNDWRLWKTENKYCKKKKGDNPVVFLPTPHGLLPMKCTPEQYEQFQRDGNKLKIKPIDHGDR